MSRSIGRVVAQRVGDQALGLVAVRQGVLGLGGPGAGLGLVERPLAQAEDGLGRLGHDLATELDALGQDDLLLRGEERDARDLAQVEPDAVLDLEGGLIGAVSSGAGAATGATAHDGRPAPRSRPAAATIAARSGVASSTGSRVVVGVSSRINVSP